MNKAQALTRIKEIQNGAGIDREALLALHASTLGELPTAAKHYWNDPEFHYGFEYGYMMSLMEVFGVTREDLA